MLQIVTGVPGSGKTYYAVDYLYDTFLNEKSKHFKENTHFFTNINEFKFDMFDEGVAFSFNYDDFYSKICALQTAATTLNYNDKQLKEEAVQYGLVNCLIIIDEAQNFFDRDDKVLIWWVSYHRHLNQNIILLTQSLSLLNLKYKKFSETFLNAQSSSLRVFGNIFRFKQYIDAKMYKDHFVGSIKIKFNQTVFSLYHSGGNTQGKKVIVKYALIAVGLLVVALAAIYAAKVRLTHSLSGTSSQSANSAAGSSAKTDQNITSLPAMSLEVDIRLLCSHAGACVYNGISLDSITLENYKKQFAFRLLGSSPLGADFIIYRYKVKRGFINEVSGSSR
jgi:zona occludens toxin